MNAEHAWSDYDPCEWNDDWSRRELWYYALPHHVPMDDAVARATLARCGSNDRDEAIRLTVEFVRATVAEHGKPVCVLVVPYAYGAAAVDGMADISAAADTPVRIAEFIRTPDPTLPRARTPFRLRVAFDCGDEPTLRPDAVPD